MIAVVGLALLIRWRSEELTPTRNSETSKSETSDRETPIAVTTDPESSEQASNDESIGSQQASPRDSEVPKKALTPSLPPFLDPDQLPEKFVGKFSPWDVFMVYDGKLARLVFTDPEQSVFPYQNDETKFEAQELLKSYVLKRQLAEAYTEEQVECGNFTLFDDRRTAEKDAFETKKRKKSKFTYAIREIGHRFGVVDTSGMIGSEDYKALTQEIMERQLVIGSAMVFHYDL